MRKRILLSTTSPHSFKQEVACCIPAFGIAGFLDDARAANHSRDASIEITRWEWPGFAVGPAKWLSVREMWKIYQ